LKTNNTFHHIVKYALPYRSWFVFSFFLAIIISGLTPIRPYLMQTIIDQDLKSGAQDRLTFHCSLLFGLLIFESLLRFSFVYATSFFSQNIVHDLRQKVFSHLMGLHVQYFDNTPTGKLTTRTINDVETINEVYSDNFFTIVSDVLTIIFVLGAMLYTDVKLTLISLTTLPFLYIATYVFKEKTKITNQKIRDKIGDLNAFAQEHFMGYKIIKSFLAETKESFKFDKLNKEFTALNIKSIWYFSWFFPVLEALIAVSIGLVVSYVALYGFQSQNVSIGIITSFLLYLNLLFRPMRFFADKFNQIQMGFVASERVFSLIDNPSEEENRGVLSADNIHGNIKFSNVSFSYVPNVPILKDISFQVPVGTSLAIIGATGSGKTSIINVLNRFYDFQAGTISIDDTNILDFELQSYRRKISMVLQDVYLFSGSILDNIQIESNQISKDAVIEMAKELDIHDFFMKLPNDYDFHIRERGNSLSHGQRQIISLFRAIVKNPAILILDEATSSIDSNTEYYIQKLIEKIVKSKTSIIIAHRLSTVMQADQIMILGKGEILGIGSHQSLLDSNTHYQKYFVEQKVLSDDLP
jgi:ATP-binding cassette, subfamily B, multidrug efflux pump